MAEYRDTPQVVNRYDLLIRSFTEQENWFLRLAPAVRMKKLNVLPFTHQPKCPVCKGDGFLNKQDIWCDTCGGWGYVVKHLFDYLDCDESPGMVIYRITDGVVVDYFTFGKKVTVEI